jgi:O-antigen ligase
MATGIALYLFVPMVPDTSMDRLKSTFETMAQGDLGGRLRIWTASFAVFVQHPLTGVGSGALPSVHNVYLSILAETGLFGLLSFLFVVATAVRAIFQQSRPYFWLWLTVFIIWSIGASVHTWEQRKPTWLFLLLMVTSAAQFKMSPNGMDTALAQSA